MGKVSHYRDTFMGGGACWVKGLWFDRGLGEIGEGKRFSGGQGIQYQLDSIASPHQNTAASVGFSQAHIFRLSLTCPFAHLTANRVIADLLFKWHLQHFSKMKVKTQNNKLTDN